MSVFDELGLPDPSLPSGAPASVFASLGLPDPVAKPSGIARRALGDTGVSLAKGIIGVPEAAVGLANLPTGGMAGKAAQAIGFAPKEWKESLDEYYSPEQKAANAAVHNAEGFGGTLKAAIQNPSVIAGTVAESLPLMIGGGVVARALPAGLSAVARGAIGEGIVGAGSASEQMRQASEDGLQSPRQAIASLASGAGTAAFGALGGKLSQKMGIADVDTLLAGGSTRVARDAAGNVINKGLPRRVIEGGLAEGALEELPQSMWEQAAQNVGTGQPLAAGVPEAGAMGMLAGTAMGSVAGGIYKPTNPQAGPIAKAAATGELSGANEQMRQEQAAATIEATNETNPSDARAKGSPLAQDAGTGEAPAPNATVAGAGGAGTGMAAAVQRGPGESVLAGGDGSPANSGVVADAASPVAPPQNSPATFPIEQQAIAAPIADTTLAAPVIAPQPPTIEGISNGTQAQEAKQAAPRRPAQPATAANSAGVAFTTPAQPTTNAGPLPQQSVAMPVKDALSGERISASTRAPAVKDSFTTAPTTEQVSPVKTPLVPQLGGVTDDGVPTVKDSLSVAPAQPPEAPENGENGNRGKNGNPAIDLSTRTDQQLAYLSTNGQPGHKEAAIAEIARRAGRGSTTPVTSFTAGPQGSTNERAQAGAQGVEETKDKTGQATGTGGPRKAPAQVPEGDTASGQQGSAAADLDLDADPSGADRVAAGTDPQRVLPVVSHETATDETQAPLSSADERRAPIEKRKSELLWRSKAKEAATKADEARTIAARSPEVASLADRLKAEDRARVDPVSATDTLPAGWSESRQGGMATNKDRQTGGIVDRNIKSGKWFFIAHKDGVREQEGFDTRAEAIDALESAIKPKVADQSGTASPSMQVSKFIQGRLAENRKTTWQELFDAAAKAWGSTLADGKYSVKDAYDAMEIGVNLHIRSEGMLIDGDAKEASAFASGLTNLIDLLPTQTKRTAEQDEFQQFSTPPALSYVASWAANIGKSDTMMEPSAGTGDLAIWAEQQGAGLILNELSDRRAKILQELFPKARVFTENAEQINNTLPEDAVPTVVVMNPPFSSTAGRVQGSRNTMNGAKHIEQALKRLADGGRLVAIVGEGMAADRPAFTSWWKAIAKEYNVRANIGIDGKEYAKYGTTFSNQILVFDKTGPTTGNIVTGNVASVAELPALLEGIRNDRLQVSQRAADQQESAVALEGKQGASGPAPTDRSGATDAVVSGGKSGPSTGSVGAAAVGGKGPGRGTGEAAAPADGEERPATADAPPDANGERGRLPDRPVGDGAGSGGNAAGGVDVSDSGAAGASEQGSLTDSVFENYTPQRLRVAGAKPHPGNLVQSAAMASVEPPAPTYKPNLQRELIDGGKLSVAQIESIVYAGQAHEQFLPNGERRGFFIGDGTGVGKGREIAGIILDNIRQGRKKAVWVSFSEGLINDAQRDFEGIGGDKGQIFWQGKTKPAQPITAKEGILFTSYSTMKSAEKKQANDTGQKAGKTRLDQIVDWLGADFDGAIVFDEAHSMGNIIAMPGKRGIKKPSQQALAGANLQKMLPKARIVYVSATGATEVSNLGYASRLGLWGEGTAFPGVREFITGIAQGGVAAMELISRDMKALGMYIARSLSFDGVTYQRLDHELTPLQTDIYNELARAWQGVLKNVNEALGITGGDKSGSAKSAAMAAFWGSHQRFFNQVITSLQTPTVIDDMRKQIAAGNALVVQLVNTNEATQEREVAKAQADGTDLEELDFTPRQMLLDYVRNSFPVQAFEQSTDDNGNLIMVPVMDAAGNPVFDKDAVAMRERLLKTLEQIRVPGNPIDEIIQAFGSDAVGEVTGRKRRFVSERGEDGTYRIVEEKRGKNAAHNDAAAFQGDKKKILIFSQAGGTGFSFHADNTAANQRKRVHYILQPGWRADAAVQGFGRTHRTNQASAPIYILPTTNLKAQKRFVSSIARRLDQLGALTRGHRQATSQGMFSASDNLESQYAADALKNLFNDMYRGNSSLDFGEIAGAMGLDGLIDQNGGLNTTKLPEIPQFLNRLLSLESFQQDEVFAEFEKRLDEVVNFAIQTGTYDTGLQTLKAQSIVKVRDEVAHTDPRTGAETRYVEVDVSNPIKYVTKRLALEWAKDYGSQFSGWFKDAKGEVFGLTYLGERVNSDGETAHRGVILKINGERRYIDNADQVRRGWRNDSRGDKQTISTRIDDQDEAMTLLEAQINAAPKTRTKRERMIVGVILPVWDRVQGDAKIVRLQTDSGERMIGRMMSEKEAKQTVKNLGLGASVSKMSTKEIVDSIRGGSVAYLANGWQIAQVTVSGEKRLEIRNRSGYFTSGDTNILNDQGVFFERIEWKDRAFIPVGKDGEKVFERVTESKPVVDLVSKSDRSNDDDIRYNVAADTLSTPADRAIYGMVADGKSSAEVLSFISKASRRPFNRVLASHLARIGVTPNITLDSQGGWQFGNTSRAQRYAAAYNPKTDTVALFTPRDAERHALHEFVHSASLKAIAAGGTASVQMRGLFLYLKRTGALAGQYGMSSIDEFVAEAFSNPKFQQALKAIPAPAGSGLKSAWQWFVRAVARVLGLRTPAMETALDRAMTVGAQLMRENAALLERNGEKLDAIREADAVRYSADGMPDTITVDGIERPTTNSNGKPIAQDESGVRRFYEWFGKSAVTDAQGRPLVVYHGTDGDFNSFDPTKQNKRNARMGMGFYFTTDEDSASMSGDRVISAYLRIENQMLVSEDGSPSFGSNGQKILSALRADPVGKTAELRGQGYDGIQNGNTYIAFSPEQIKSATGNSGQFSPDNPDIRYNIATDWISNPTISDFVANATRSDKSTSIITPFNTQYHKAHKWAAEGKPLFKRVFDLGQKFLSDTSRFAVMAQDAAPALFHEVKSLADAKAALRNIKSFGDLTGATHRKDIDAAASPLYEGTLYGGGNPMSGIVFSDSKLRHTYKLTDRQIRLYREALAAVNVSMDEMAKSIIARHAKQNDIDFNADMGIDDMAEAVIESIEERKDDLEYAVGAEMEEEAKATAENLRDMDQPEEAAKVLATFKKRKKDATSTVARLDKTIADIKGVVGKNKRLQEHGYFPLMRFGKHTVTAKDAEGNTAYFGMFDGIPMVPQSGQYQANKVAAAIRAEHPEWEVTTGIHNTEKYKLYEGMNLEAVQLFAEHMDKDSLEPFQEFLRLATGDRSVLKRLVHRQGTPGFDRDVRRTLAQFIVSNARHTSSSYNLFDMRKAAESANADGGDIGAEAVKLYKYVAEPTEEAHQLRAFLFFNFLGGSIAAAMVNLSQVPMMTFPYLTQYESAGKLANRLRMAAKTAIGDPAKIPGALGAALVRAEQDGVTAPQEIHQLTATAANSIFSGNPAMTGLLRFWGMPFSMAESFNRRTTFIAALQIAEAMTPAQLAATGTKSAFEFAERAVTDTQGIYNKGNRMNVGRGAVGATIMTFKQFSIMYLELLKRLPRNQQLLMLGIMTLAAGAGGWPFAEDVEDIIDTFGQWLGFGTNSKRWIRNTLAGATSPQIADILLNGAASQMGIDLHSRLGTHNLLPGSGVLKQSSTDKWRDASEFFGPAASVLQNAATALQEMATGHAGRAVKAMAPVAAQNAIKGYDMASTGYAEDAKGRRTIPVSGPESAAKGIGFNPKAVADFGAIKRDIAQDTRMLSVKREEFTSAIADAILSGDMEARKDALAEMAKWNEDNPKMRVVIAPGAVIRRVKAARMEGADRFLKAVPKTMRADSRQEIAQP